MKAIVPYISIVITSYNREQYIVQAIESVLAQDCRFPIEIIIADDCSTDNTRWVWIALIHAYKAEKRYLGMVGSMIMAVFVCPGTLWRTIRKRNG